jgi:hypothetical protein
MRGTWGTWHFGLGKMGGLGLVVSHPSREEQRRG